MGSNPTPSATHDHAAIVTIAGLCGACSQGRPIRSGKGSTFFLCERSRDDPRYVRYPPLPMLACAGFEPSPPPKSVNEVSADGLA